MSCFTVSGSVSVSGISCSKSVGIRCSFASEFLYDTLSLRLAFEDLSGHDNSDIIILSIGQMPCMSLAL